MSERTAHVLADRPGGAMWHVTLTMRGEAVDAGRLRAALERLAHERPFLLSARFARDRAELRYWEEAACLDDAAALALRLWGEHRVSSELPEWSVVGLEVVDKATFQWRGERRSGTAVLAAAGQVAPF